jgi:hypothetical protein
MTDIQVSAARSSAASVCHHLEVAQHGRLELPPQHREGLLVPALGGSQQFREQRPDHHTLPGR